MKSNPQIVYTPRPDASSGDELNALAAVYRFVLDCRENEKVVRPAPEPNDHDDVKESNGYVARTNCNAS